MPNRWQAIIWTNADQIQKSKLMLYIPALCLLYPHFLSSQHCHNPGCEAGNEAYSQALTHSTGINMAPLFTPYMLGYSDIDGLVQERCNSSVSNELCLSCTNPSIYSQQGPYQCKKYRLRQRFIQYINTSTNFTSVPDCENMCEMDKYEKWYDKKWNPIPIVDIMWLFYLHISFPTLEKW